MTGLEKLVAAIVRMEGANDPKSVNQQMVKRFGLHNPGHLVWARQRGAKPVRLAKGQREWAGWPSYEAGLEGIARQIRLDATRGHTLDSFIHKYAPTKENKTAIYLQNVCLWTGYGPRTPLKEIVADLGKGE